MAEDADPDSKTEEPSAKKLEDAKKRGDVPKSQDLPAVFSLAACGAVLVSLGGSLGERMLVELLPFIDHPHELLGLVDNGGGTQLLYRAALSALPLMGAVFFAMIAAGVSGNVLQTGLMLVPDKLKPDFKKLNPMSGFKRLFGPEALMNFAKQFIKLIVTGLVVYNILKDRGIQFINLAQMSPAALLPYAKDVLVGMFVMVVVFLFVGAIFDYALQRFNFMKRMRMSKEELKEEYKQAEGDPHVKAKLRQLRMEKSRRRMMSNVPQATVVVTNPTHFAVALRYVEGETPAPLCVAKGVDELALKIREIATEKDIPIVENPPLARALYASVDLDQEIPTEHFQAVAAVIKFVREQASKASVFGSRRKP